MYFSITFFRPELSIKLFNNKYFPMQKDLELMIPTKPNCCCHFVVYKSREKYCQTINYKKESKHANMSYTFCWEMHICCSKTGFRLHKTLNTLWKHFWLMIFDWTRSWQSIADGSFFGECRGLVFMVNICLKAPWPRVSGNFGGKLFHICRDWGYFQDNTCHIRKIICWCSQT